jgi:hypothetical protein
MSRAFKAEYASERRRTYEDIESLDMFAKDIHHGVEKNVFVNL